MNIGLYSLFCDDIRQELGDKVSLIGIYGSHMYVHGFPARLPKLCTHFSLSFDNKGQKLDIAIAVKKGEELIREVKLEGFQKDVPEGRVAVRDVINGGFDMVFLEISEPTKLTLSATVNGETVLGGELVIEKEPVTTQ